jgi:type I restriction enzyme R subunit
MTVRYESEAQIEQALIDQLTSGESQWTYREDLTTDSLLWENFFEKLEQNNVAILNGVMLTKQERQQLTRNLGSKNLIEIILYYIVLQLVSSECIFFNKMVDMKCILQF